MFFDIKRNNSKSPKSESLERMKTALAMDEMSCAGRIGGVIKSDFFNMLTNYMDVSAESVRISIEPTGDGRYIIRLQAEADRVYDLGVPPMLN